MSLESTLARLHRAGVQAILADVRSQPAGVLASAGLPSEEGRLARCESFDDAIALARLLVPAAASPPGPSATRR